MPGGHTPFGTRVSGNRGPVIDPGTLSPVLYLSGLPNDGVVAPGGTLTNWFDKIANYNFTTTVGSAGVTAFNDGSVGEPPGIWAVSACGGNFFRGWDAHGTLPGFSNANGYTQYLLVGGVNANPYGEFLFTWPSGVDGLGLIYQGPTFNGGGGNLYFGTAVPGNIVITHGSSGFDTGIVTPTNQTVYDLWTLVSDGVSKTTVYRNGVAGPVLNTGVVGLATNLTFGGPSAGTSFVCSYISSYILYTAQHTPSQIAGVRRWFRQHYGV